MKAMSAFLAAIKEINWKGQLMLITMALSSITAGVMVNPDFIPEWIDEVSPLATNMSEREVDFSRIKWDKIDFKNADIGQVLDAVSQTNPNLTKSINDTVVLADKLNETMERLGINPSIDNGSFDEELKEELMDATMLQLVAQITEMTEQVQSLNQSQETPEPEIIYKTRTRTITVTEVEDVVTGIETGNGYLTFVNGSLGFNESNLPDTGVETNADIFRAGSAESTVDSAEYIPFEIPFSFGDPEDIVVIIQRTNENSQFIMPITIMNRTGFVVDRYADIDGVEPFSYLAYNNAAIGNVVITVNNITNNITNEITPSPFYSIQIDVGDVNGGNIITFTGDADTVTKDSSDVERSRVHVQHNKDITNVHVQLTMYTSGNEGLSNDVEPMIVYNITNDGFSILLHESVSVVQELKLNVLYY